MKVIGSMEEPAPLVDIKPLDSSNPKSSISGKVAPAPNKVLDIKNLSEEEIRNDPLLQKLKAADINNDGVYSTYEVMKVCRELNETAAAKASSDQMVRRLVMFAGILGFLLMVSMVGNFCSTMWAIAASKEESVPDTSGVMLTKPAESGKHPQPVGTSTVKVITAGMSGLKEATKEELDKLEEISFFHDGGYHKIKASQIHRYDGRVEIWGSPVGLVVVEDTGEVHYAPHGVPSVQFENCFGENAPTATSATDLICGESVDNEPPSNLEVEDPQEEDPDNAPAPAGSEGRRLAGIDESGEAIWHEFDEDDEYHAEARRLSSRRRAGGGGPRRRAATISSAPRRRSGQTASARRRATGSFNSYSSTSAYDNARRRSQIAAQQTVGGGTDTGRRRVVQHVDGESRRRYPNYYNTPTDSRRRDVGAVTTTGNTYTSGGQQFYQSGGTNVIATSGNRHSVSACPTNMDVKCDDVGDCWCEDKQSSGQTAFIVLGVVGSLLFCSCLCGFLFFLGKSD